MTPFGLFVSTTLLERIILADRWTSFSEPSSTREDKGPHPQVHHRMSDRDELYVPSKVPPSFRNDLYAYLRILFAFTHME